MLPCTRTIRSISESAPRCEDAAGASVLEPDTTDFLPEPSSTLVSVSTVLSTALAWRSVEVMLIRHAIPVRRELESGAADPELSPEGERQSELLAEYLSTESLDAIFSSPMRRARQTAAPLSASFSLDVSVIDGIAEYDRHSEWYVPVEELKAANDPRWQELISGQWTAEHETQDEFIERVRSSIEQIIADHPSQRVAIVCHGGVINAYIASILGLENKRGFFYPNYTSIHRIAAARSGERSVVTLNETTHLRGSGLPIGLFQK